MTGGTLLVLFGFRTTNYLLLSTQRLKLLLFLSIVLFKFLHTAFLIMAG
jgi:hypothetical protein